MRAILFDWMMEVCNEFTLKRETYYLSVYYIDRFLSNTTIPVEKDVFQLVGLSALNFACKVEEIYAPRSAAFVKSADNGYTKK